MTPFQDHPWSESESLINIILEQFENLIFNSQFHILSVYGVFSDRVGLPLHNIPSPFLSVMRYLFSRSQVLPYPLLNSLTMSLLVFQLAFCHHLQTPYISSPNHPHLSSSHVHTIPVYHL